MSRTSAVISIDFVSISSTWDKCRFLEIYLVSFKFFYVLTVILGGEFTLKLYIFFLIFGVDLGGEFTLKFFLEFTVLLGGESSTFEGNSIIISFGF